MIYNRYFACLFADTDASVRVRVARETREVKPEAPQDLLPEACSTSALCDRGTRKIIDKA